MSDMLDVAVQEVGQLGAALAAEREFFGTEVFDEDGDDHGLVDRPVVFFLGGAEARHRRGDATAHEKDVLPS